MTGLVSLGGNSPGIDAAALQQKEEQLFAALRSYGRVLVAYSGGTDSAYLAWAARQALGHHAVAITADSPSLARSAMRDAAEFARQHNITHRFIDTGEFSNPDYVANNADRCFHCKDELFQAMTALAAEYPDHILIYGVNQDDLGDYRPGQKAARLHEVKAPLVDAGLTKAEIRELSRRAGLATWDRPAAACLSSRIPYGTAVTPERLLQVENGEEALHALGFRQARVRYHGELARIEIAPEEMPRALTMDMARTLTDAFRAIGFTYVTLDLAGYRQGSLNEVLPGSVRKS